MEVELRDNSVDYEKLQNVAQAIADKGRTQSGIQAILSPFQRRRAAAAGRRRPGQGGDAGRPARRRLPGAADLSGLDLRQPVQPVRPHLPGLCPGRSPYRVTPEEISRLYVRNANGDMVPIGTMAAIELPDRAVADQPLQPAPGGAGPGRAGARLQLRSGARAARADRERDAAARHGLRVDRHVLSGEGAGQPGVFRLRAGAAAGLSGARGPVRELERAGRGAAGGADRAARHGRRADPARRRQQSLHADRPRAADRARQQERDPDRRVRARSADQPAAARSWTPRSRRRGCASARS